MIGLRVILNGDLKASEEIYTFLITVIKQCAAGNASTTGSHQMAYFR